ncbi:MAG TPA: class II fructose-bisphosphate aldolase [Streptosporangiaceae bacterium]|nr:class II fructose-bisphosphate aldolase [Streptosporangiaceae bacterium]
MTLHAAAQLIDEALGERRGIAAFNVITLEHAEAIVAAAEAARAPVILALSQNAVRFHGDQPGPVAAAAHELARQSRVPVALHLDHVDDAALLAQTAALGFSSVMFDASALPLAENLDRTRDAVHWAHDAGLWLEAELGYIGGKPGTPARAHDPGVRTDPDEAHDFVAATGVDALAVAVGSSHAMTARTAVIDIGLVAAIRAKVPVPLVLHGSSGVPDDQLRAAIRAGITKVNIGTALNVAMTMAIRERLTAQPALVDPRRYLAPARDAMAGAVSRALAAVWGC